MIRTIPLTQGYSATVDDEDYAELSKYNWTILKTGGKVYAIRHLSGSSNSHILMHRQILDLEDGVEVDHIDGDGLNNCRDNLRPATRSQNSWNRLYRPRGHSKYRGVYFKKREHKWVAQLTYNNRSIHIGYFKTEEEAALAWNKLAMEMYGEYARLNDV